jgi:hypothetical protein
MIVRKKKIKSKRYDLTNSDDEEIEDDIQQETEDEETNNNNNNQISIKQEHSLPIIEESMSPILFLQITDIPSEIYQLNDPLYIPDIQVGSIVDIYYYKKRYAMDGLYYKPCFSTFIYNSYKKGHNLRLITPNDNHEAYKNMVNRLI